MGDQPLVTVTVPIGGAVNPAAPIALVTFYQAPAAAPSYKPSIRFADPNNPAFVGDMTAGTWVQGNSWFYWDNEKTAVFWGFTASQWNNRVTYTVAASSQTVISDTVASSTSGTSGTSVMPTDTSPSPGSSGITLASPTALSPTGVLTATSSTATHKPSSSGLKTGVVAGIAIGCLIAGALIAGIFVWYFLGRKRKAEGARGHETSAVALIHGEKGANARVMSVASGSPISQAMENSLPQPLEDKTITGKVSKISNSIKNHVQSFYHTSWISPGTLDLDDLQKLGDDLPMSTGTLSTLLNNSDTREIALRFCIAWVTVSRMQLHALPSSTFLPPEVAGCFSSMSFMGQASRAQSLYLSKWRVITAELMQLAYARSPFSAVDTRSQNIQKAVTILEGILQPYADSRIDNNQRRRNLEEILKRSAVFAFTLFSQPNSWGFDWQDDETFKSGSLCVFPALVQVTDESGNIVEPPRPFSEAMIRRLDE